MPTSPSRAFLSLTVFALLSVLMSGESRPFTDEHVQPGAPALDQPFSCGTSARGPTSSARAVEPFADGTPLSFEQMPAILSPAYRGDIQLRQFTVLGDIPELRFRRYDPELVQYVDETWTRTATRSVSGRLLSIFEPVWPNQELAKHLRRRIRGFDYPSVLWGYVQLSDSDPPAWRTVSLRLGSTGIPAAPVTRLDDTVQFSSHVVNLVVPDYGSARYLRPWYASFDDRRVAYKFYEQFADVYDALAIVPAASQLSEYSGRHAVIRNEVKGIGLSLVNDSTSFGSHGRLHAVETYPQTALNTNDTSNHEIAHQWGHYFDWRRLGMTTQDAVHAPLLFAGETLVGNVLEGTRRVGRDSTNGFKVERTTPRVQQHPLELYAMGLLAPADVPPVTIFAQQDQFAGLGGLPTPGTPVIGAATTFTINDVLGLYGPREGPVSEVWRRATIVVSEALISQEEMDYWNFFSARLEDARHSGVVSYDGYVSFDASTGGRIDLQTDIVPKSASAVTLQADVDTPRFGRFDCPDLEFAATLPTVFGVGDEARLDGRVITGEHRYDEILVRYWKYGGASVDAIGNYGSVTASGTFSVRVPFTGAAPGSYALEVFLFWPDSGAQYARCTLSPVAIVAQPPAIAPTTSKGSLPLATSAGRSTSGS